MKIPLFFILSVLIFQACTYAGGGNASYASLNGSTPPIQNGNVVALSLLMTATHANVDSESKNWDADAEEDGLIIYPNLRNNNDETVEFENIELNVDIEIWTTKYDSNYNEIKNKNIYNGTGKIRSWKDGNVFFDGGIKIDFDDIKTKPSDESYGQLFVRIHTPDGKSFEAKETSTQIKPN